MKKLLGWCLRIVLGLAALLALFHLEENWRGKHAWESWRAGQEAKGVHYDWTELAPPEVPDAENFAKATVVEPAVQGKGTVLHDFPWPQPMPLNKSWRLGQQEDLAIWSAGLKGKSLDAQWAPWERDLALLAEAARRPSSRIPLNYSDPYSASIPAMLGFRSLARVLRLRALMRLRDGRPEQAMEDVVTNLRIAEHVQREPLLVENLLAIAVTIQTIQPIWEGVDARRWNQDQLTKIQHELEELDLIRSHRRSLEGERIWSMVQLREFQRQGSWERAKALSADFTGDERKERIPRALAYWLCIPKGWIYQEFLKRDRFFAEAWLPILDPIGHRVDPTALHSAMHVGEVFQSKGFSAVGPIYFPALMSQSERVALRQNEIDEALIACALERYRLDKGVYPSALVELSPTYLTNIPKDVITGGPLHYHPNSDGTFTLYSVGWNGKDEDGRTATTKEGGFDQDQGDWVWPSPRK